MSVISTNPFASCNGLPGKDFLLGRTALLQNITAWLQRERHLSLYGMLHIGKSSLLHAAFLEQKALFQQNRMLFVVCNLPSLIEIDKPEPPEQFFHALVEQSLMELEEWGMMSDTLQKAADEALVEGISWGISLSRTQRFFQRLHQAHLRIIFLLEHFDHITEIFQQRVPPFARLQQLPNSRSVHFITESFHPLKEIIPAVPALSSLINGFDQYCLGLFDEHDMRHYFARLASTTNAERAFPLTSALQEQITHYCGRHPYLLVKLGYELAEYFLQTGQVNLEGAIQATDMAFFAYAANLKSTLREEQLTLLSQATISTQGLATQDVQELEKYGLICPDSLYPSAAESSPTAYMAFLPHFQEYLQASLEDAAFPENQIMYLEETINHRYTVVEHLETNGHNQVVKAWDKKLRRHVVLKRLHLASQGTARGAEQEKGLAFLLREAEILAALKHEHIATVYDVIPEPLTIVMEWIEGETLDLFWQQGLSDLEVVHLGRKLAQALKYLHMHMDAEGSTIIHRDIKPQNIVIRRNGDPVLIDFGIARATRRVGTIHSYDRQGQVLRVAATPKYAAPEQMNDPQNVTNRADIYSLGLVLYEALTRGQRPVTPLQPDRSPDQRIPAAFWQILCAMLSQDPLTRPDADHLHQNLEDCLQLLHARGYGDVPL